MHHRVTGLVQQREFGEDAIITADAESNLAWLRTQLARLLGVPEAEVETDQPLGELGIDSLTAAEFSAEIEEDTGANVPLERFLGGDTLEEVARRLAGDPRGFDPDGPQAAVDPDATVAIDMSAAFAADAGIAAQIANAAGPARAGAL